MMGCREIVENENYSETLLMEVKKQSTRNFILLVSMSIICGLLVSYIFYDRYMDSQFEIEATSTEIVQDSNGYNSYIDGIGDINNNGTESKESND